MWWFCANQEWIRDCIALAGIGEVCLWLVLLPEREGIQEFLILKQINLTTCTTRVVIKPCQLQLYKLHSLLD